MGTSDKVYYASVGNPSVKLLYAFQKGKELDIDGISNAELLERAERYYVYELKEGEFDFRALSDRIKKIRVVYDGETPASFKVRICNVEVHGEVIKKLKRVYNLQRVMTPLLLNYVLYAYIEYLSQEKQNNLIADSMENVGISLTDQKEEIKAWVASLFEQENNNAKDALRAIISIKNIMER